MHNLWHLPLTQFSKSNHVLWVCWFLGKNLSDFVHPVWKLHNPYCHTEHNYNLDIGIFIFRTLSRTHQFLTRKKEGEISGISMNEIKRNEKVHNMKMIASWSKTKFFHEVLHSKVNVLSEKVVLRIWKIWDLSMLSG